MEKLVDLVLLFAHFDERGLSVQESLNTAVSSTQPVNEVRYYQLSNFRSWTANSIYSILLKCTIYWSLLFFTFQCFRITHPWDSMEIEVYCKWTQSKQCWNTRFHWHFEKVALDSNYSGNAYNTREYVLSFIWNISKENTETIKIAARLVCSVTSRTPLQHMQVKAWFPNRHFQAHAV